MKREWLARGILVFLASLLLLGITMAWRSHLDGLILHARMAEQGGWDPATISSMVGQPIHLRLTSDDVAHSFAVGQTDWPAVDVLPGEVTQATLTFDRPGKYVFYCTRWCGPNHWRMRGTIEVSAAGGGLTASAVAKSVPLYIDLNLDIDAPHPASAIPQVMPSASTGEASLEHVPIRYRKPEYLRSHSPDQIWRELRDEPFTQGSNDQQVWNLVAALWRSNTTQARLNLGAELYAQNCAACHGENGAGDGVFAQQSDTRKSQQMEGMSGEEIQSSPDFTDPSILLGASPALLEGKIVRGGMGTGMPYWGPIFTDDQIWAVVEYLYSFQFSEK